METPFNPIGYAFALALGWFLKNRTKVSNQAIPVINFAVQFLGLLLQQIAVTPAEAGVFGAIGHVGNSLLPFALEAIVNTVAAAGTQSGAKATGRIAWAFLKKGLLIKGIQIAVAEAEKGE